MATTRRRQTKRKEKQRCFCSRDIGLIVCIFIKYSLKLLISAILQLLVAYVIAHSALLKAVDEFVRMRGITRSVKVALKCLIAVVLVDDDFPY